jgi:hypothetical protein
MITMLDPGLENELNARLMDLECQDHDRLDSHVRRHHASAVRRLRFQYATRTFAQACLGLCALLLLLGLATAAFVDLDRKDIGTCYFNSTDIECDYQPNAKIWFMAVWEGRVVFDNHAVVVPRRIQACTEFYAREFSSNESCGIAVSRLRGTMRCELTIYGGACTDVYDGNGALIVCGALMALVAAAVCTLFCCHVHEFSSSVERALTRRGHEEEQAGEFSLQ